MSKASKPTISRCSICGAKLMASDTGADRLLIPWWDCGGDCLLCMAHAGDPDAIRQMYRWLALVDNPDFEWEQQKC